MTSQALDSMFVPLHRIDPHVVVMTALERLRQGIDIVEVKSHIPLRFFAISDPLLIRTLYAHPQCGKQKPPYFLKWANWFMGNGLFNDLGGPEWKAKRQLMTRYFTPLESKKYLPFLSEAVDAMTARWDARPAGAALDTTHEMQLLITDFSHRLLFGEGAGARLEELTEISHWAESQFSNLCPVQIPTAASRKFRRYGDQIREYFKAHARRKADRLDPETVLAKLKGVEGLTEDQLIDQLFSVHFGVSAMSAGLTWHLYLIGHQRAIQERLAECLRREGDGYQNKYLTQVSNECLRYLSPFFCSLRFSYEKLELGGRTYPKGSTFMLLRFLAQRHPLHWKDPEVFDPERFAVDRQKEIEAGTFIPFGYGARTCLGAQLGQLGMRLAFGELVSRYRFETATTADWPSIVDFRYGIFPTEKISIRFQQRSPDVFSDRSAFQKNHHPSQIVATS